MKIYTTKENGVKKYKAVNQKFNGQNVFYTPASLGTDKIFSSKLAALHKVGAVKVVNGYGYDFSANDYAQLDTIFPTGINKVEIKAEFITGDSVNSEQMILWQERNDVADAYFGFQTHPNATHFYCYSYNNGTVYQNSNFTVQPNTKYVCTLKIDNGTLSWSLGEPNNLIEQTSMPFDMSVLNNITKKLLFGKTNLWDYSFKGTINFNETYIKINDTFFFRGDMLYGIKNFGILSNNYIIEKGPIYYDVVGNPTINNGIVSDFSYTENNKSYLKIEKMFFGPNIKAEYVLRFKLDSNKVTISNNYMNLSYWPVEIYTYIGNSVGTSQNFYAEFTGVSGNLSLGSIPVNSFYSIKIACDGAGTLTSYNSQDGQTWTQVATKDITGASATQNSSWHLGYRGNTGGFAGEIDLNNSFVKKDGWAWFGSANLVWANKNLFLNNTDVTKGNRVIIDKIINVNTDEFEINFCPTSPTSSSTAVNEGPLRGQDSEGYGYTFSRWYTSFNGTYWSRSWNNVGIKQNITYKKPYLFFNGAQANREGEYSAGGEGITLFTSSNGSLEGKIYDYFCKRNGRPFVYIVPVPQGLKIGNFTVPSNGMYDMVEQKFYPNAGTGEFVYGKD